MNADVILELLNYTNAYVVMLDGELKIVFSNRSLTDRLGFETMNEIVGRCWLDFIPKDIHGKIKSVHGTLLSTQEHIYDYQEFTNEIMDRHKNVFKVKWINTAINHTTNVTFSFGIPQTTHLDSMTEEDLRSQFRTVIESDRATIKTLKDYVRELPKTFNLKKTCDLV
jgi:PAS domain S-box-containing protein